MSGELLTRDLAPTPKPATSLLGPWTARPGPQIRAALEAAADLTPDPPERTTENDPDHT